MEFTPGPWYTSSTVSHQGLVASEKTGENIAVVYKKKNAPILAAAPDLFEACKKLLMTVKYGKVSSRGVNRIKSYEITPAMLQQIQDAVSKATD